MSEFIRIKWNPGQIKIKYWLHGWIYKQPKYVKQIKFWGDENESYLCHTSQQEKFLKNKNHLKTLAVGSPFCYVPKQNKERIKGSLLIMPPHCTKNSPQRFNEGKFWNSIRKEISNFSPIFACVTPDDAENGNWKNLVIEKNIPVLEGATLYDSNALLRMRALFETFETILSPNLGSQFPYAGLCGCKLSWFGAHDYPCASDYFADPFYKLHPEILEEELNVNQSGILEKKYAFLRKSPREAESFVDWAKEELGFASVKEPKVLLKNLYQGVRPGFFERALRKFLRLISETS